MEIVSATGKSLALGLADVATLAQSAAAHAEHAMRLEDERPERDRFDSERRVQILGHAHLALENLGKAYESLDGLRAQLIPSPRPDIPDPPTNVTAEVTVGEVTIRWDHDGVLTTKYAVKYRGPDGKEKGDGDGASARKMTFTGLAPGAYTFDVVAQGENWQSDPATISVRIPGAPDSTVARSPYTVDVTYPRVEWDAAKAAGTTTLDYWPWVDEMHRAHDIDLSPTKGATS